MPPTVDGASTTWQYAMSAVALQLDRCIRSNIMNDRNTNIHFNSADEPIKHQKWQEKEEKRLSRGDGWRVFCFICGIIAVGGWMAIVDPVAQTPATFITALGFTGLALLFLLLAWRARRL